MKHFTSRSFELVVVSNRRELVSCVYGGYTLGMKAAVSIPDEVFKGAERLARRTKRSRRRIFSDALREYLTRHSSDEVTEAVNRAHLQIGGLEMYLPLRLVATFSSGANGDLAG
jgi:hypothetical protein